MINNALGVGLQGVQEGMRGLETTARQIARAGQDGLQGANNADGAGGITEPLVNSQLYERSVEASAQVVKTADETVGTLLDTTA
ncbi:hypothetical protein C8D92_10877 [Tamilnaduibacter salinus]|uniref:Flagellar biosynthesis protein FlgE n=1 Tax=Tamilnaduibacter salinus TaxID=1484056 RepID=A0A2A2I2U7_9GAMM|nr:flagellar biosynthesis protein FlgE [Tamilnaduibacter salinus]PAV26341.1 flagellar biosynthesis protein FlgE [Tamilnaduibacter salinus]PVY70721.1 hypothetical protein C8D92_10877 [Tamilnaduibacter salinus]